MIRKATQVDLEQIFSIYKYFALDISRVKDLEYSTRIQTEGFLLDLDSKEDFLSRILNNYLFNVYEANGEVLGFIIVNREIYFPEDANNIIWFDPKLKKQYFHSDKSIVLHEIIVDKNHHRKGIGTELFLNAVQTLKENGYTDLYSIVATAPLIDCASIIFHSKQGFERACVSMPDDLFGLKNYQSLLFHKKIN